jgi:16S rRNA (cytosine967-C5)-methyltransferase
MVFDQRSSATVARQVALSVLHDIERGAFADVSLQNQLSQVSLNAADRRLVTELVYGTVRRQRTLDALISQLGKKRAEAQVPELLLILRLGLYQLRYLDHVPSHAVVDTSVELAKLYRLMPLTGVVNGILRQYTRLMVDADPLQVPVDPVLRLGVLHSYPDWIVREWQALLPLDEVDALCQWFNQPPHLDLRVNPLVATRSQVSDAFDEAGVATTSIAGLPLALRLSQHVGDLRQLPGYEAGWWSVQDASAQLVGYLVDPQPGDYVIDACAAPGGKATQLAELMGDKGEIWGCDRTASKLKKIHQNQQRLQIHSIHTLAADSRHQPQFHNQADKVLLDVPCSGLGTLHRHADARWRQSLETIQGLVALQKELLTEACQWVKPNGSLVYSTCTLQSEENEQQIETFLREHPDWQIEAPPANSPPAHFAEPAGWVKILPHRDHMDGFFMVKLRRQ